MSESAPRLPEARARIGEDLGQSEWFTIGQREVDVFSALTDDWDYMHNDPEWAASRSWGGTIAHGLYVLSCSPVTTSIHSSRNMLTRISQLNFGVGRFER